MAKPEHFPQIEDTLRLFVVMVERGQTPPNWLLQFMAGGAREFLKGGKPWQKGKGGRPKGRYGPDEARHYLLHYYGKLKPAQVASALGLLDLEGKDVTATVRRAIKRGELAFCMAKIEQVDLLKSLFADLLELELADLTEKQRRKCIEGLKRGLADLLRDDVEPAYS